MPTCPMCAEEIPAGSKVCPYCEEPTGPRTKKRRANDADSAAMRMILPVGRSLWAIAAGYFGLFSLLIFPAPIALILGIVAIWDIRTHPDRHGMGRAIFAVIMGGLGSALILFFIVAIALGR